MSSAYLALLVPKSPTERLIQNFLNNPFAGIHQLAWFDWAMLIPYFTVLLDPFRLRPAPLRHHPHLFQAPKKATGRTAAKRFEQLPPVTIQLPLYNERYVVERLIEEVVKIEYPKELLQIQVLDDSTDDTAPSPKRWWSGTATLGYPIEYHHRTNRHGYKAGALQEGLKTATGELVAIFDADFCPPPDFLTAHHPLLRRSEGRRGADALELPESRLQLPDRSGSDAAGRPLHPGARRPFARGLFLQLQRHGGHPARAR